MFGVDMSYEINSKDPFLETHHPLLKQVANEVPLEEIRTPEFQKLLQNMKNLGQLEQKDKKKYVMTGLAAPQLGINKRVILVDIAADVKGHVSHLKAYINPKITSFSKDKAIWYEGCYSVKGCTGIVERPFEITIEAFNEIGEKILETHSSYVARIFQHEIDHLNGVLFIQHIDEHTKLHHIPKAEDIHEYRNKEQWKNWKNYYSLEEFKKLKKFTKKEVNPI
jgi:peptide deformylase